MAHKFEEAVEDLQHAVHSGRPVREHGPYGLLVGDESLQYRPVIIEDPVPTGRQILEAAGISQSIEHLLFQMLASGYLEEIRPDETTDLRSAGAEKFLIFRSDRSFRFQLNDRAFDWGATRITGATLKKLAGVDPDTNEVWLDAVGGKDRLIEDHEFVDLSSPGVERFVTRPILMTLVVNARRKEWHERRITYWQVVKLAFPEATPSESIIYSITYARGPAANPEGSLAETQEVKTKDKMTFYVTPTDKS